ncbi:MAG: hypothetical protein ABII00_15915 [Elusimicrobiota bacterium]
MGLVTLAVVMSLAKPTYAQNMGQGHGPSAACSEAQVIMRDAVALMRAACSGKEAPTPAPGPIDLSRLEQDGWLLLTDNVANRIGNGTKYYLYVYEDRYYMSPATTLTWSWDEGQELTGEYTYFDGQHEGTVSCEGYTGDPWDPWGWSAEIPMWGVGCSEGGGGSEKILTYYDKDPANAQGYVCQDIPDAFGIGACAWATMYVFEAS